jgi:hypothetical protein
LLLTALLAKAAAAAFNLLGRRWLMIGDNNAERSAEWRGDRRRIA